MSTSSSQGIRCFALLSVSFAELRTNARTEGTDRENVPRQRSGREGFRCRWIIGAVRGRRRTELATEHQINHLSLSLSLSLLVSCLLKKVKRSVTVTKGTCRSKTAATERTGQLSECHWAWAASTEATRRKDCSSFSDDLRSPSTPQLAVLL